MRLVIAVVSRVGFRLHASILEPFFRERAYLVLSFGWPSGSLRKLSYFAWSCAANPKGGVSCGLTSPSALDQYWLRRSQEGKMQVSLVWGPVTYEVVDCAGAD